MSGAECYPAFVGNLDKLNYPSLQRFRTTRTDGKTDILISTQTKGTKEQKGKELDEIERLMNIIESLKGDPARGIEMLVRTIDQVFLNPEKFNDDSILTKEERASLKGGIAKYRAEEFQRTNRSAKAPFARKG